MSLLSFNFVTLCVVMGSFYYIIYSSISFYVFGDENMACFLKPLCIWTVWRWWKASRTWCYFFIHLCRVNDITCDSKTFLPLAKIHHDTKIFNYKQLYYYYIITNIITMNVIKQLIDYYYYRNNIQNNVKKNVVS